MGSYTQEYSGFEEDEDEDEYEDDWTDRREEFRMPTDCQYCHSPFTGKISSFSCYQGNEVFVHPECLQQAIEKDNLLKQEEYEALDQMWQQEADELNRQQMEQERIENRLDNRLKRAVRSIFWLLRAVNQTTEQELECLANLVLNSNRDYYGVPNWFRVRHLAPYQREMLIAEADWAAEGSLSREELEQMDDQQLARAYLGALHDYCMSQGFFG